MTVPHNKIGIELPHTDDVALRFQLCCRVIEEPMSLLGPDWILTMMALHTEL